MVQEKFTTINEGPVSHSRRILIWREKWESFRPGTGYFKEVAILRNTCNSPVKDHLSIDCRERKIMRSDPEFIDKIVIWYRKSKNCICIHKISTYFVLVFPSFTVAVYSATISCTAADDNFTWFSKSFKKNIRQFIITGETYLKFKIDTSILSCIFQPLPCLTVHSSLKHLFYVSRVYSESMQFYWIIFEVLKTLCMCSCILLPLYCSLLGPWAQGYIYH